LRRTFASAQQPARAKRLIPPVSAERAVPATRRLPAIAAPAPAEVLRRAERLGHRIGLQHLPPDSGSPVQRYFRPQDLVRAGNVPRNAKVSEDLNIVSEGPQKLYATRNRIDEGNAVLEQGSKIVLDSGPVKTYDLESTPDNRGFRTISFDDYHRVIPRFNPRVPTQGENLPREISPERGDSKKEIGRKHQTYVKDLILLKIDLRSLEVEAEKGRENPSYAAKAKGLASLDRLEWFQATLNWQEQTEARRQVLGLGLGEVRGLFLKTGDPFVRTAALQRLALGLNRFLDREAEKTDSIALPTDCGKAVAYVVTGEAVKDDRLAANPGIGSNYYTVLPENEANVGWNVHWAGVILKGGPDNVTLESAGGLSLGGVSKGTWWMDLYGTVNVDQTFKKRLHRLHVKRSRKLLAGQEQTGEVATANKQLHEHQQKVASWTTLDSDQK
jgi:hypothetical protein